MIEIGKTIVSKDLFTEHFVCDLSACKGACCVEGDAGAPLENAELPLLDAIYEKVKPYLRPEGIASIEEHGKYVEDWDGEFVTPLVKGKECAYLIWDKNNIAKCGIEKAWEEKKIDFKKPISCHLYPIRVTKYSTFEGVNYHQWDVCEPACKCGAALKVKVFRFLKEPLIRKYGEEWYKDLEEVEKVIVNSHS